MADPKDEGGSCYWHPGKGLASYICVGVKETPPSQWPETIIHEILESIFIVDNKQLRDGYRKSVFHFNHDYLDNLSAKILDAMYSSGIFCLARKGMKKLVDARPKPATKKVKPHGNGHK
jgi:hypothetical protein